MATKQLKLKTETDFFGTSVTLATKNGDKSFVIGTRVPYDPLKKLSKTLAVGYLFRSPNVKPEDLSEIWPTIEGFEGKAVFSAIVDTKSDEVTAFVKIEDKSDATMFAFTHSIFEKWSAEKQAEAEAKAKEKPQKVTINDDGTVTVKVESVTLGD